MQILIVEDDTFFQKFYAQKLTEQGFTVIVANNGKEAIEEIKKETPNLILLDLIMPEMDGFEFLQTFAKTKKHIPILVFSTLGQEEDIKKAKDLGATDYVNKSFFDFPVLLEKIKNLVHNT
jgi:DNA-binding response OmpR family regulator